MDSAGKDPDLQKRRDIWLAIYTDFMEIYNKNKTWKQRSVARYRAGLALEELARRSHNPKDFTKATRHFADFAKAYSKDSLADDALFHKAAVEKLAGKKAEAAATLKELLRLYPDGDMAASAKRMSELNTIPKAEKQSVAKHSSTKRSSAVKSPARSRSPSGALLVLLDPGHGGRDQGTAHNNIEEKTIALDLAQRIGKNLASAKIRFAQTRNADIFLSLEARCQAIQTYKAALFVSIHVNAAPDTVSNGLETYFFGASSSRIAAVENKFGIPLQIQSPRPRTARSWKLAKLVQSAAVDRIRKNGFSIRDRGVLAAPFHVLRASSVPSILIEVGYCTSRHDAMLLANPKYRAQLAAGIAWGIQKYLKK